MTCHGIEIYFFGPTGGHSNVLLTVLDGDDNTHKVIRHVASDGTRPVQFASSLQSGG